MKTLVFTLTIILIFSLPSWSQTADVTSGCAELNVNFTAPQATSYFWEFGNGATSELQNPEHSYVQPGDYTVKLYQVQGGPQVGNDIKITVYPKIEFSISADVRTGCAPLEVNFTSQIIAHPDIVIKDIVWTFGDGASASGESASYTYNRANSYDVSLKVITENNIKCEDPEIFEDYIIVEGARTAFTTDKRISCEIPAEFIFTNRTTNDLGSTYNWNFANGQTSTERGPLRISYDRAGLYEVTLTTTTPAGCVTDFVRSVNVGAPVINLDFPDTICIDALTKLRHSTIADQFIWSFSGSGVEIKEASDTLTKEPEVKFNSPGLKTFTLTAISDNGCETSETLSVFVYEPNAEFIVGPDITCAEVFDIELEAIDKTMVKYIWNPVVTNGTELDVIDTPDSRIEYSYEQPDRDIWYVNVADTVVSRLTVISPNGCASTVSKTLNVQRPEAFHVPDVIGGCVPFDVNFSDFSTSDEPIIQRDWDFGDGNSLSVGAQDTLVSHTYTTPGIHEVFLTITNEEGCKDISRRIEIIAIRKDTIEASPNPAECMPSETSICVGDSIFFEITTVDRNLEVHIENDNGRLDHCLKTAETTHRYLYPGEYPLSLTVEYYGLFLDSFYTGLDIEVFGSKPKIDYQFACNPGNYTVDFDGRNSINANSYKWYHDGNVISEAEQFSYTFPGPGDYMVYLASEDLGSGCRPMQDSVMVHMRDITAGINIPDEVCANQAVILDASNSKDVDEDCFSGYVWSFENQRPREVGADSIFHSFLPGEQTVTLTVEDINGCTDSVSKTLTAFEIKSDFELIDRMCLPSNQNILDKSIADKTINTWEWDFGSAESTEQNPEHTFTEADLDLMNHQGDTITVNLYVEDELGCKDTSTQIIALYEIESEITMDQGPIICENEIIMFSAADFVAEGSYLDFNWDLGPIGTSTEQNPTVKFDVADSILVTLNFTEASSGCVGSLDTLIDVVMIPDADFETPFDDEAYICFPEQIPFTNTTVEDRRVLYSWDFGNGANSTLENPVIPFDKGTWEVTMVATSIYGCRDTVTRSFTLLGPEGQFEIDKTEVCPNEEIQFTMVDPVDVSTWTWDFGDGNQIDNQNPVTHSYSPESSVTSFNPTLIIRSDETGCESVLNIPINLSSITADFIDSTGICPGEISLFSQFDNPQSLVWEIDGQIIEGDPNPSVSITSEEDKIEVVLKVVDSRGCEVERRREIDNPDLGDQGVKFPNVFTPNGDTRNPFFNVSLDPTMFPSEPVINTFKVYNRWGELIYDNADPINGWNGNYKGERVPADVYAYYIELQIEGCSSKSKKGNVTVVK